MIPISPITEAKLIGGAGLALLIVGGAWWFVHHRESLADAAGYSRGHAEFTTLQADMTAKALAGEQAARLKEATWNQAQKENANESERIAARDQANHAAQARATGAADERLRSHITAITARSGSGAGNPGSTGQCAADITTLGSVLQACRTRYVQLGHDADEELDDARKRGSECASDYDSLKSK